MAFLNDIDGYFNRLKDVIDAMDRQEIDNYLQTLMTAYEEDATIFIFGNGGSASTASHMVCDLNKGVSRPYSKRFRAICLSDNLATLMAYANDESYEKIFVEPMRNFFRPGDVAIGISGSGNSPNVLRAIEYANEHGGKTIGITGYPNGKLQKIAQMSVNANVNDMQLAEDIHIILNHLTMKLLCGQLAAQSLSA